MELVFVTGNKNKAKEAAEILDNVHVINEYLELTEVQGEPEEIIKNKLSEAYITTKRPLFVEDTGLFLDALNGLPGPYIKDFLKNMSHEKLSEVANISDDGRASAKCFIGYIDHNGITRIFTGEVRGRIVKPRGESNFGWDPVFMPDGFEKTFAEMTSEEKNRISHRRRALEAFRDYLNG